MLTPKSQFAAIGKSLFSIEAAGQRAAENVVNNELWLQRKLSNVKNVSSWNTPFHLSKTLAAADKANVLQAKNDLEITEAFRRKNMEDARQAVTKPTVSYENLSKGVEKFGNVASTASTASVISASAAPVVTLPQDKIQHFCENTLALELKKQLASWLQKDIAPEDKVKSFEDSKQFAMGELGKIFKGMLESAKGDVDKTQEITNLQNEKMNELQKLYSDSLNSVAVELERQAERQRYAQWHEGWERKDITDADLDQVKGQMPVTGAGGSAALQKLGDGVWRKKNSDISLMVRDGVIWPITRAAPGTAEHADGYGQAMKFLAASGETTVKIDFSDDGKVSLQEIKILMRLAEENGLQVQLGPRAKAAIAELPTHESGGFLSGISNWLDRKGHALLGMDQPYRSQDEFYAALRKTNTDVAERYLGAAMRAETGYSLESKKNIAAMEDLIKKLDGALEKEPVIEDMQKKMVGYLQGIMTKPPSESQEVNALAEKKTLDNCVVAIEKHLPALRTSDPKKHKELSDWCNGARQALNDVPQGLKTGFDNQYYKKGAGANTEAIDWKNFVNNQEGVHKLINYTELKEYLKGTVTDKDLKGQPKEAYCEKRAEALYDGYLYHLSQLNKQQNQKDESPVVSISHAGGGLEDRPGSSRDTTVSMMPSESEQGGLRDASVAEESEVASHSSDSAGDVHVHEIELQEIVPSNAGEDLAAQLAAATDDLALLSDRDLVDLRAKLADPEKAEEALRDIGVKLGVDLKDPAGVGAIKEKIKNSADNEKDLDKKEKKEALLEAVKEARPDVASPRLS